MLLAVLSFLLNPLSAAAPPPDSVALSPDCLVTLSDQQPKKTSGGWVINKSDCTISKDGKTYRLYGKVKIVDNFEDFKVKIVDNFEDVKIHIVDNFENSCGKVKIVNNFEDVKVKIVDNFEDIKVKIVTNFEGLN